MSHDAIDSNLIKIESQHDQKFNTLYTADEVVIGDKCLYYVGDQCLYLCGYHAVPLIMSNILTLLVCSKISTTDQFSFKDFWANYLYRSHRTSNRSLIAQPTHLPVLCCNRQFFISLYWVRKKHHSWLLLINLQVCKGEFPCRPHAH